AFALAGRPGRRGAGLRFRVRDGCGAVRRRPAGAVGTRGGGPRSGTAGGVARGGPAGTVTPYRPEPPYSAALCRVARRGRRALRGRGRRGAGDRPARRAAAVHRLVRDRLVHAGRDAGDHLAAGPGTRGVRARLATVHCGRTWAVLTAAG